MIRIEGIDEAMRALSSAPEKMDKIILSSMRSACKPITKELRNKTDKRYKKLVKAKVSTNKSNQVEAWIGLFNNKQKNGKQGKTKVDDWFKAYWANYGTLENRDPSHQFQYPLKKHRKTRHNYPNHRKARGASKKQQALSSGLKGIRARHFYPFDDGMPQHLVNAFTQELAKSMKQQEAKVFK